MKIKSNLIKACVITILLCVTKSGYSHDVYDAKNHNFNKTVKVVHLNQLTKQENILNNLKEGLKNSNLNTALPGFWIWDKANSFESNIEDLRDKFDSFSNDELKDYLKDYHNVDFYKDSKCFKFGGCTPKQMSEIKKYKRERLEAMRKSSTDIAKGIDNYLLTTTKDLQDIEELKLMTKSADGQMKAAQYSNQWLYIQTKILMDLNSNMQLLQNQMRVVIDESYASKAMQEALSDRAGLKMLETNIQSLPTSYEYLNLK